MLKNIKLTGVYKFANSAEEKPSKEEYLKDNNNAIEFIKRKYEKGCIFGQDELLHNGLYKYLGYIYTFNLKKFLNEVSLSKTM